MLGKLLFLSTLSLIFHHSLSAQNIEQIIRGSDKIYYYENELHPEYIDEPYAFILKLEYKDVTDSLTLLLEQQPTNFDLYYYRAWSHFINSQVHEAYEDVRIFMKQGGFPKKYYGHILIGKIYYLRQSDKLSIEEFDKAIRLDPKKVYAYSEKSKIYAYSNFDPETASHFIGKAIKNFPNENEFYLYRAIIFSNAGESSKANKDYEKYLTSSIYFDTINYALSYFGLAKNYLQERKYEKALEATNMALLLTPDNYAGLGVRGEINYHLKDNDAALSDFLKMETKFQNSKYWVMIGEIYEKKGDKVNACYYYGEKCRLFPSVQDGCSKFKKLDCN